MKICSAPLLMLDINAPLQGDVSKAFKPYDHDMNLALFQSICAHYEIAISQKDAEGLMRHIESFECDDTPHHPW
jgi:hypothetical protein